jgi:hypothetical protein
MFRNEARYLREWIEFYRIQGTAKFYLYNNLSTDNWQDVLSPYIAKGIVDITEWPYPFGFDSSILNAQTHCIERLKGRHDWLALLDPDEFAFSPHYNTLWEAIQTFPQTWGAIGIPMMNFGAGDETEWRDAPVIERFTWRPAGYNWWNYWIKSIVRLDDPGLGPTGSGHHFKTNGGTFNELGDPIDGARAQPRYAKLRLNHYFTKSRPEWEERHPVVTDGSTWPRREDRWTDVQDRDVDDRTIWKFLPQLKERLGCP